MVRVDPPEQAPPPANAPAPHLDFDLACTHCEYNLRTLPVDGLCPECGRPIGETLAVDVLFSLESRQEMARAAEMVGVFTLALLICMAVVAAGGAIPEPRGASGFSAGIDDLFIGAGLGTAMVAWILIIVSILALAEPVRRSKLRKLLPPETVRPRRERGASLICWASSLLIVLLIGPGAIAFVPFAFLLVIWRAAAGNARLVAARIQDRRLMNLSAVVCTALPAASLIIIVLCALAQAVPRSRGAGGDPEGLAMLAGLTIILIAGVLNTVLMLRLRTALDAYSSPLAKLGNDTSN
jgi:hypothetical protein